VELTKSNSVVARLAGRFQMDPRAFESTVRKTLMPSGKSDVSNEQLAAFLLVADQYNLNPFTKELYAFDSGRGGIGVIVPIDGWYRLANDHPKFDGIEYDNEWDENGQLLSVTARVYRKDRSRPTTATEYMLECKGNSEPWKRWPRRMLRHKATIQALRAAFSFSGIVDEDEADRIRDVELVGVTGPRKTGVAAIAQLVDKSPRDEPCDDEPEAREAYDDAPSFGEDVAAEADAAPGEDGAQPDVAQNPYAATVWVWDLPKGWAGRTLGDIAKTHGAVKFLRGWVADAANAEQDQLFAMNVRRFVKACEE